LIAGKDGADEERRLANHEPGFGSTALRRLENDNAGQVPPTRPGRMRLRDAGDQHVAVSSRMIGAVIPQNGDESVHRTAHAIMIGV
jgi:hypothetical protein